MSTLTSGRWWAMAGCALSLACGTSETAITSGAGDVQAADSPFSLDFAIAPDQVEPIDSPAPADVPMVDTAPEVADSGCTQAGCACSANADCDSQFCIETPAGQQCAQTCAEACPSGFKCGQVSASGGDILTLCVPAHPRLCEPCAADSDCSNVVGGSESRCLAYHDAAGSMLGAFCGARCDASAECPAGYTCQASTSVGAVKGNQCLRNDLVCPCDPRATALQLATSCSLASAAGTCDGKRSCGPAGLGACSAAAAAPEQCNKKDDNCDGQTDEPSAGMCDDNKTCTYDNCVAGACQHPPATGPCSDGSACTTGDKCSDGDCTGTGIVCDDDNGCTKDGCDLAKGCTTTLDDGAACSDGTVCTVSDACKGGACLPGATTACDDGNPCTTDSCSATAGCVFTPNSLPCSDGDVCTLADACAGGGCAPGGKLSCVDGNVCTDDACDAKSGCTFAPHAGACSDGSQCTEGDACSGGACVSGAIAACDDGNPCTSEVCLAQKGCIATANNLPCSDGSACSQGDTCGGGACVPGKALACSDGNPCTDDSCDAKAGCVFTANSAVCSDNNVCTQGDVCTAGQCQPGGTKPCNDDNPCTDNGCHPVQGCVSSFNSLPCSDSNACTVLDVCSGGACQPGSQPDCEDNNPCTSDTCNKTNGCQHSANTAECSDGNACSVGDACLNLACTPGKIKNCNDGKPCTDDACDPVAGCVSAANSAACTDGNACTQFDTCSGGACKGGSAPVCNDGNPCTDDACDPVKGCTQAANTASCNDGNACTASDACSGGACVPGSVKNCGDGNACTNDSCDAAKGCVNVATGGPVAAKATLASNITAAGFAATWVQVAGATSYFLDVSTASDFSSFLTGYKNLDAGNAASASVSGLGCNTVYFFRVRAANACGTSLDSNTILVSTGACTASNIAAGATLSGTPCPGPVTSIPITRPSGVSAGNVLVAGITASGAVVMTAPAGWVAVGSNPAGGANCGSYVFYKVAGSSEPATYTFSASSGTYPAWVVTNFTGTFANPPLDKVSSAATGGYTAPGITTSAANAMVVMLVHSGNGAQAWTAPAGMTAGNAGNINCTSTQIFYGKQTVAGATGTKTAPGQIGDVGAAYLLALH